MITMTPAKVPAIIGTGETMCVATESEIGAVVDADDGNNDMTRLVRGVGDSVFCRMRNVVGFNDELQTEKRTN